MTDGHKVMRFCPSCGEDTLLPASVNSFTCGSCGFELFLNVASAVAALIQDPSGRLLLTTRAKNPAAGMLDLPGGFVDPGETTENALKRELSEELGCREPLSLHLFGCYPNTYPYQGVVYQTLDFAYIVDVASPETLKITDSELADAGWFYPDDIPLADIGLPSIKKIVSDFLKKIK